MFLWHQRDKLTRHVKKITAVRRFTLRFLGWTLATDIETPDLSEKESCFSSSTPRRPWFSFKPKLLQFNQTTVSVPAVTQCFFQMSFPSTLKPTATWTKVNISKWKNCHTTIYLSVEIKELNDKKIIDELFYWAYWRAFGENYLDFPENAISRFT